MMESLVHMLSKPDVFMRVLAGIQIVGLGLAVYRFFALTFMYSINSAKFLNKVFEFVRLGDVEGAINFSKSSSKTSLPKVAVAALEKTGCVESEVRGAVSAALVRVRGKLEQFIPFLSTLANIAVLIGVLGAIAGLIESFGVTQSVAEGSHEFVLQHGIQIALVNSGAGLLVAIVLLFSFHILQAMSGKILNDLEYSSILLVNELSTKGVEIAREGVVKSIAKGSGDKQAEIKEDIQSETKKQEEVGGGESDKAEAIDDEEEII